MQRIHAGKPELPEPFDLGPGDFLGKIVLMHQRQHQPAENKKQVDTQPAVINQWAQIAIQGTAIKPHAGQVIKHHSQGGKTTYTRQGQYGRRFMAWGGSGQRWRQTVRPNRSDISLM